MSFVISDLVIESIIRDGLTSIRQDPSIIDDVFAQLKESWIEHKYGEREINKIKNIFTNKEVAVVHSFKQVPASLPCISIQLLDNPEDVGKAHLDDFEDEEFREITDPEELADLVVEDAVDVNSVDTLSGTVFVDDSVDLSQIHPNHIFVDVQGEEFYILGGIDNTPGQKQFLIAKGSEPDISAPTGFIKSAINTEQIEHRGVMETDKLILGVHTKEPLLTKYLYTLLKYFLLARKADLIRRGFQLATYSGSDFTRNLDYQADSVFSRFLTASGMVQNSWSSDKVTQIDYIELGVLVEKDEAGNVELNRADQTVKVKE